MTVKYSTGAINNLLGTTSFRTLFNDCCIKMYTGAQPVDADSPVTGTWLGDVTVGGLTFTPGSATNALSFDAPVLKVLSKAVAEAWQFKGAAAGTMGWFRVVGNATDAAGSSTTLPRIDGSVGITTGDMRVTNVTTTIGGIISIDAFTVTWA